MKFLSLTDMYGDRVIINPDAIKIVMSPTCKPFFDPKDPGPDEETCRAVVEFIDEADFIPVRESPDEINDKIQELALG